jgi:hypothetical protein
MIRQQYIDLSFISAEKIGTIKIIEKINKRLQSFTVA